MCLPPKELLITQHLSIQACNTESTPHVIVYIGSMARKRKNLPGTALEQLGDGSVCPIGTECVGLSAQALEALLEEAMIKAGEISGAQAEPSA